MAWLPHCSQWYFFAVSAHWCYSDADAVVWFSRPAGRSGSRPDLLGFKCLTSALSVSSYFAFPLNNSYFFPSLSVYLMSPHSPSPSQYFLFSSLFMLHFFHSLSIACMRCGAPVAVVWCVCLCVYVLRVGAWGACAGMPCPDSTSPTTLPALTTAHCLASAVHCESLDAAVFPALSFPLSLHLSLSRRFTAALHCPVIYTNAPCFLI